MRARVPAVVCLWGRMCGAWPVYEPPPGCFMCISRHGGVLLACTCVGCCCLSRHVKQSSGCLRVLDLWCFVLLLFAPLSDVLLCCLGWGGVCCLLRWRSGIRCARKGASRAQSKFRGLWRTWVDGGREPQHWRSSWGGWGCQRASLLFWFGVLSSSHPRQTPPPPLYHQVANGEAATGGPPHGERPRATRPPQMGSPLIPRVLPSLPMGLVRRWASDLHPPTSRRGRLRRTARGAPRPQLSVVYAGNWQLRSCGSAGAGEPQRRQYVLHHIQHAPSVLLTNTEAMPLPVPRSTGWARE